MKNTCISCFYLKNFSFSGVKFSIHLNRRVFVMYSRWCFCFVQAVPTAVHGTVLEFVTRLEYMNEARVLERG